MKTITNLLAAGMFLATTIVTHLTSAQTWTRTSAPALPWRTVACSADGIKLVAAGYFENYRDMQSPLYSPEPIYASADAGTTWTQTSAPSNLWTALASSADGSRLVAVAAGGVYTSPDSGATWTQTSAPTNHTWSSAACSADGTKLIAATGLAFRGYGDDYTGQIYISTNAGVTWTQMSAPSNAWITVACSANGTKLLAADNGGVDGSIYTSTNSGLTWMRTSAPANGWASVASSSDGTKLVAVSLYGIYTSSNSGLTWASAALNESLSGWGSVASSADGTKLFAAPSPVHGGPSPATYESSDSGITWNAMPFLTDFDFGGQSWGAVNCSADGSIAFATENWLDGAERWLDAAIYTAVPDGAQPWKVTNLPGIVWSGFVEDLTGIFRSTDGSTLVAVAQAVSTNGTAKGVVLISPDSGSTWIPASVPGQWAWSSVAGSEDGSKLVVVAVATVSGLASSPNGPIYTSSDSGATWIQASAPTNNSWTSVTSSSDGTKIAAAAWYGTIYTSANSGLTWTTTSAPTNYWTGIASSRDGTKLAAVSQYGPNNGYPNPGLIYNSKDSGATWTLTTAPSNFWTSVASSADGTKLVAAAYDWDSDYGVVYTSGDSGATWIQTSAPTNYAWSCVASSADGTRLVAAGQSDFDALSSDYPAPGLVYYSMDSGATWAVAAAPHAYWNSVACSREGTGLIALAQVADYSGGDVARIFSLPNPLFRLLPSPLMSISPSAGSLGLSWLVPSTSFVLQQNSDLTTTNWTAMPTPPLLNFSNLHYEVTVSPTMTRGFYRLRQK